MRASFIAATVALLSSAALAAPLEKRGGFWHEGKWVDDGYYAWAKGDRTKPFEAWANGKPDYAPTGNAQDSWDQEVSSNQESSSSDDSTSYSHSGSATFFYQGGNSGACGSVHSDSDYIVALPYASSPMSNCGKTVKIARGSTTITAKAADICPSCAPSHIDLSVGAFTALGNEGEGVIPIQWTIQ